MPKNNKLFFQNCCTLKVAKRKTREFILFFTTIGFYDMTFMQNFYSCMLSQDVIPLSSIHVVGKTTVSGKLLPNRYLQDAGLAFTATNINRSYKELESVRKKTMPNVFTGNINQFFNFLCQNQLVQKVSSTKFFVTLETLPSTKSATRYHSFQTCFHFLPCFSWVALFGDFDVLFFKKLHPYLILQNRLCV